MQLLSFVLDRDIYLLKVFSDQQKLNEMKADRCVF